MGTALVERFSRSLLGGSGTVALMDARVLPFCPTAEVGGNRFQLPGSQ